MSFFSHEIWRNIFKVKIFQKTNSVVFSLPSTTLIYSRKSSIPLCFKDSSVSIHKGMVTRKLELNKYYINSKFGEYAYTRKLYYYPLKKKNRR